MVQTQSRPLGWSAGLNYYCTSTVQVFQNAIVTRWPKKKQHDQYSDFKSSFSAISAARQLAINRPISHNLTVNGLKSPRKRQLQAQLWQFPQSLHAKWFTFAPGKHTDSYKGSINITQVGLLACSGLEKISRAQWSGCLNQKYSVFFPKVRVKLFAQCKW